MHRNISTDQSVYTLAVLLTSVRVATSRDGRVITGRPVRRAVALTPHARRTGMARSRGNIMQSHCPTCNTLIKAPETSLGRRVRCPACQAVFVLEQAPPARRPRSAPAPRHDGPVVLREAQPESTRECPFCAEPIKAHAKRCRHCGETLDPALRAAEEAKTLAKVSRRGSGQAVATNVVVHQGGRVVHTFPHVLHLVITICTCGCWLPIWIIHYIVWACIN